jgi:hypothetical protein
MNDAAGLSKKSAAAAMSLGVPTRPVAELSTMARII